ncbi:MAG: methyltransferase domain-containing protein [Planctomycetaceae bacterium]|nr:methyltransferase domain-containing protein [Planctomycetaceae bacterium]
MNQPVTETDPAAETAAITSGVWPRHLLRHLLLDHNTGVGSRVLHVGQDGGELVRFLTHLGIQADQLDDDPAARHTAAAGRPGRESTDFPRCHYAGPAEDIPFESHQFDLIIVDRLHAWAGTLNSPEALLTTARLLSAVKPGGYLAVVRRSGTTDFQSADGHRAACYAELLTRFPGTVTTTDLPEGLTRSETWNWVLGRRPRPGYSIATVQIPSEGISRNHWLQTAILASSQTGGTGCCDWAETHSTAGFRRAA